MEETKHCPYCDEIISPNAIKCKHCGSILNKVPTNEIDFEVQIRLALENKFEIIKEIGRGGMATVYKAIQKNLKRTVALKIINKNLVDHKDFLERFHREAQLAASLNNPNIVTIYDEGCENGVHYISMEYLDGSDLHDIIQKKGRLRIDEAINIVAPIAEALDYAHDKGIIHRDIKSNNIIITSNGKPVLTDFGIAHAISDTRITQTGMIIGTPDYMSPEQALSGHVDALTDLYSLGVVLYECITGDLPFKGETPVSTIYKIINDKFEPINKTVTNAPRWLTSIVNKILAKNKNERFKSGKEFSHALRSKREQVNNIKMSAIETIVSSKTNFIKKEKISHTPKYKRNILVISIVIVVFFSLGYLLYYLGYLPSFNEKEKGGNWNALNEFEKKKVELLLEEGDVLFENNNLVSPPGKNAAERYNEALKINLGNKHADDKLNQITILLKENSKKLIDKNNMNEAKELLLLAQQYFPNDKSFSNSLNQIKLRDLELKTDTLIKKNPLEAYKICQEIKAIDSNNSYLRSAFPSIRNKLIDNADKALENKNFKEALNNYNNVKTKFGMDNYIEKQISICNSEIEVLNNRMPNLVGLTIQKAQNIISSNGLIKGKVSEILSAKNKGKVITQIPKPGIIVKKGTEVKLIIGK